eukprot:m.695577 g.695577  ORF g.695577 m.695577 type:complete len:61 (-) comp22889_c0_seq6:19-201(-)
MPTDKAIQSGYLVKLGAKVKNWKLRWMVLQNNGIVIRILVLLVLMLNILLQTAHLLISFR